MRLQPFARYKSVFLIFNCIAWSPFASGLDQDPQVNDPVKFYLAETIQFESNIFRLANDANVETSAGPSASREDVVNQTSFGFSSRIFAANQSFDFDLRVDDNRYKLNRNLNHISDQGLALWNWKFSDLLAGKAGFEQDRWLGEFADNQYTKKDVLTDNSRFFELGLKVFSRMRIVGEFRKSDISHDAADREVDNFGLKTWRGGLEYQSPSENALGLDYIQATSNYPNQSSTLSAPAPDYTDNTLKTWVRFSPSAVTHFLASSGYLRREYVDSRAGNFSGPIGEFNIEWTRISTLHFIAGVRRELNAFRESGAESFVLDGLRLSVDWTASEKLQVVLSTSVDKINYQLNSFSISNTSLSGRNDKRYVHELRFIYMLAPAFEFNATFHHEQRTSTQSDASYSAEWARMGAKFKF